MRPESVAQRKFRLLAAWGEAPLRFLRHVVWISVQAPHEEAREPGLVDESREQSAIRLCLRSLVRHDVAHLVWPLPGANRRIFAGRVPELVEEDRLLPKRGELGETIAHRASARAQLVETGAVLLSQRKERIEPDHV